MVSARTLEVRPVPVRIKLIAAISYGWGLLVRSSYFGGGRRAEYLCSGVVFPGFIIVKVCSQKLVYAVRQSPVPYHEGIICQFSHLGFGGARGIRLTQSIVV